MTQSPADRGVHLIDRVGTADLEAKAGAILRVPDIFAGIGQKTANDPLLDLIVGRESRKISGWPDREITSPFRRQCNHLISCDLRWTRRRVSPIDKVIVPIVNAAQLRKRAMGVIDITSHVQITCDRNKSGIREM